MQYELDQWQTERVRLRSILHNQQNRQSMLEEQNYRLREQRSRLQEEHSRLHEQTHHANNRNSRLRDDLHSLREAQSNLSNLANAITEVGRDSYATTGAGPSRQRLYDWAATRHYGRLNDTDVEGQAGNDAENATSDVDSVPRRELERALRNYRMARSNFRSGRQPGTDLGAVPTASALRAYWNEEPGEATNPYRSDDPSTSTTPFALSEFVEQHRNERQRRHLEVIRRQNEQRRNENQPSSSQHAGLRSDLHISDAFVRVRNTIKYLSALRHVKPEQGLELARSMGLDSLHEYADNTTPSYLPLTAESLPTPQPSSWLTAGMSWHGLQSTDREPTRSAVLTRRQRREALGISMARSRLAGDRSSSLLPSDFVPSHQSLDTDRYMSSLMQDSEGRWGFNNEPEQDELPGSSAFDPLSIHQSSSSHPSPTTEVDHWPVTVTLHSVNFDAMTVSGTMRASQLPDKMISSTSNSHPSDQSLGMKSMESYFLGEIIDFRNHTLETSPSSPFTSLSSSGATYKSGGVDVDARYWARLGPFKREIERQSCAPVVNGKVWDIKTKAGEKYLDSSALAKGEDEREQEADEVMARCLGDWRWLEEKLGKRGGEWVLMRWKGEYSQLQELGLLFFKTRQSWGRIGLMLVAEKCFVDPIITSTSTSTTEGSPLNSTDTTPRPPPGYSDHRTLTMTDSSSAQWGLTISGFYYVALNRVTGELDGLYFDPGSQPFQSLRMAPGDGGRGVKMNIDEEEEGEQSRTGSAQGDGLMRGLGVRRFFPAVEFR